MTTSLLFFCLLILITFDSVLTVLQRFGEIQDRMAAHQLQHIIYVVQKAVTSSFGGSYRSSFGLKLSLT